MPAKCIPATRIPRILIVEDHPAMRLAMKYLIQQHRDLSVCGETSGAEEALALVSTLHPDLVTIDLTLERGNGLDLIKQVHCQFPRVRMLVLSAEEESVYAERVVRAGAHGYLQKTAAPERLVDAIHKILSGNVYVSEARLNAMLLNMVERPGCRNNHASQLSGRELQVLEMLRKGFGPKDIAQKLSISVKTVETYQQSMQIKLGLSDARQLRNYACSPLTSQSAP